MKKYYIKYLTYFSNLLMLFLLLISFSFIYDNYRHALYLDDVIKVTDNDIYIKDYRKNIEKIHNNLDNYQYNGGKYLDTYENVTELKQSLDTCLRHFEDNGLSKLNDGDELKYKDIYDLNNYFYNSLVNDCWVTNLNKVNLQSSFFKRTYLFQEEINILLNNSKGIKTRMLANSLYSYGSINSKYMIYNPLIEDYNDVSKIYDDMSKIILDYSNYLVSGESYENS